MISAAFAAPRARLEISTEGRPPPAAIPLASGPAQPGLAGRRPARLSPSVGPPASPRAPADRPHAGRRPAHVATRLSRDHREDQLVAGGGMRSFRLHVAV